jgi:hypothetical protein
MEKTCNWLAMKEPTTSRISLKFIIKVGTSKEEWGIFQICKKTEGMLKV